jgi:two-component system, NarL family, response regulator LiaR
MMQIYIYSEDINLVFYWEKALGEKSFLLTSLEELFALESSLIVLDIYACGNDIQSILLKLQVKNNRVLLLDRTPSLQKAKKYLRHSIKGYANALMHQDLFLSALKVIEQGMVWLHPELLTQLLFESSSEVELDTQKLEPLSAREKEVALLMKEGCTYKEMAEHLGVAPRTIKAHAQSIYTKLQVKDKLALALYLSS